LKCVAYVKEELVWLLTHSFIQDPSFRSAKGISEEIAARVRDMLASKIKENDWMDPEEIQTAVTKIRRLHFQIGYPTQVLIVLVL
jgi:predicted metalloendopeptidase